MSDPIVIIHSDNPRGDQNPMHVVQILLLLRDTTGHDFTGYKKSLISHVIERHMAQLDIHDSEKYTDLLNANPTEVQHLSDELLVNLTRFFRDPEAFEILQSEVIPKLFDNKKDNKMIRIWVAGCATGEEAYSIAILFREYMDRTKQEFKIQLFATDLDQDAIATARKGLYSNAIKNEIHPGRLGIFFNKEKRGFRIKKDIREMIIFSVQDVIKNPSFIKLDLLCCRNLLIYFNAELQDKLIQKFNFALREGGILFLSPAETIGDHTNLFTVFNRKFKMYQAVKSVASNKITYTLPHQ